MHIRKFITFFLILLPIVSFSDEIRMRKQGTGFVFLNNETPILYFQRRPDKNNQLNYFTISINEFQKYEPYLKYIWPKIMLGNDVLCEPSSGINFNEQVLDLEFVQQKDKSGLLTFNVFWKTDDITSDPFIKIGCSIHITPYVNDTLKIHSKFEVLALTEGISLSTQKKVPHGWQLQLNEHSLMVIMKNHYDLRFLIDKSYELFLHSNSPHSNKARKLRSVNQCYYFQEDKKKFTLNKKQPITFEYSLEIVKKN